MRTGAGTLQPLVLRPTRENSLDGWTGAWRLKTNFTNIIQNMLSWLDLVVTKVCDGVDPDSVDGFNNDNGIGLTQVDAVGYVGTIANASKSVTRSRECRTNSSRRY